MKINKLLESKRTDDYLSIKEINWLKDNPGQEIKKTHYKVSYNDYVNANINEPMGGHFTIIENRGRDTTRVDGVQELKDYIVRRYNKYFEESISSNEPAVKFQGKSSHTFTKDKKWEVDFDEAGNILARTRHGKPSYFKGHINDKVNDFPSTDEDNIILAAREQHGLKFGNKEVKEGYSHFEFTSGSNPYIAKTKDEAERVKRSRGDSVRYVGNINGIDYYKVDDSEKDLFRVDDIDESFKPSDSGIQSVKCYNRYNYTIQELRVDNDNKTFERGNFTAGKADKKTKNRQEFEDVVDTLKELGYTEIKSDYHSMRNKSRKGNPTNESYWIENKEVMDEVSRLENQLDKEGWNRYKDKYSGSKYYSIFARRGENGAEFKAVKYNHDHTPKIVDLTYKQVIGEEPLDSFDGLRRKLGRALLPTNESTEQGLTYEELMELARKNYNKGGDSVYECWGKEEFDEYVKEFGPITKEKAYKLFGMYDEVNRDRDGYMIESKSTHCVYFTQDGIDQIEFEGTEDECNRYISAIQAEQDDEFGDEAPERFIKRLYESKPTHYVYFSLDGGKTQEIEFEGTEDECQDYIEKQEADNEFGDEAPERFVKRLTEGHFSDDDVEDDIEHANLYGGDTMYCRDCGTKKKWDDGYSYCPKCNGELNESALKVGDKVYVTVSKKNGKVTKVNGDYITVETDDGKNPIRIDTYYANEVKKLDEAHYGGAFDIRDDEFWTRDDLNDFAEEVINNINEIFYTEYKILGVWSENGNIIVSIGDEEGNEYETTQRIDMRKIRKSSDLTRHYVGYVVYDLRKQIEEVEGVSESLKEEDEFEFDDEFNAYYDGFTHGGSDEPELGNKFFADGYDWTWFKQMGETLHLDFDNWAVWWAYRPEEENNPDSMAVSAFFVVDTDTGFIDWGPCDTYEEARDFLNGKKFDWDSEFDTDDNGWSDDLDEGIDNESPILHRKGDGSYLIAADDGYTAFTKSDVCMGHITATNEQEAKNKFNANQFDENLNK